MDKFTPEARSEIMRRVLSANTTPELRVRSLLHRMGFRFRLHVKTLPGSPDIVLRKYKTVIFVHGCFWHRHKNCRHATTPATNKKYWTAKFERNVARDSAARKALKKLGWKTVVIWECELCAEKKLTAKLQKALVGRK